MPRIRAKDKKLFALEDWLAKWILGKMDAVTMIRWIGAVAIWAVIAAGLCCITPFVFRRFGEFWGVIYTVLSFVGVLFAGHLRSCFEKNTDVFEELQLDMSTVLELLWQLAKLAVYPLYSLGVLLLKGSDGLRQKVEVWLVGISLGYWGTIFFLLLF